MLLTGGYDFEPAWLAGGPGVLGTVAKWIPGQNRPRACVVVLDQPLTAEGLRGGVRQTLTGTFVVLELRYANQAWEDSGTVHLELCQAEPPDAAWPNRDAGAWIESHATYVKQ